MRSKPAAEDSRHVPLSTIFLAQTDCSLTSTERFLPRVGLAIRTASLIITSLPAAVRRASNTVSRHTLSRLSSMPKITMFLDLSIAGLM